ncbi:hypothetical protein ACQ4PT_032840 [Festuca glaucescens]
MTVARRSLEGLVSFLIFHYRYLQEAEAMSYLRLAGADLLVAVRLIDQDRSKSAPSVSGAGLLHGKPTFDVTSPAAKIALRCAAASTRHPEPAILISSSMSVASRLSEVSKFFQDYDRLSDENVCYPGMACASVSNIILNTVWYDSTFSSHHESELGFEVDMICTNALMRIEFCSLYGLLAFIRAYFSSLTEHDAIRYLLISNADIWSAIKMAEVDGAMCYDHDGYKEAALASWHPDPDALVQYELQVICGVNPVVVEGASVALFKKRGKYEYSHINFWATPKGSNFAAPGPVLFFAQCSNGEKDEDEGPSMCIPVSASWISDGSILSLSSLVQTADIS